MFKRLFILVPSLSIVLYSLFWTSSNITFMFGWNALLFVFIFRFLFKQRSVPERNVSRQPLEWRREPAECSKNIIKHFIHSPLIAVSRDHVLCSLQMKIADKIFEICINMNHLSTKWNVHFFLFMLWHWWLRMEKTIRSQNLRNI